MITKDYFKRQATTLRKMIRVTRNQTVADRLTFMADDFENRSADGPGEAAPAIGPPKGAADQKSGHD